MSVIEIQRFAADLASNAALRAEAGKVEAEGSSSASLDGVVAFAATRGYGFTADELKEHAQAQARADGRNLTDADLDGVAGGRVMFGGFASMFGFLFGTDPF